MDQQQDRSARRSENLKWATVALFTSPLWIPILLKLGIAGGLMGIMYYIAHHVVFNLRRHEKDAWERIKEVKQDFQDELKNKLNTENM